MEAFVSLSSAKKLKKKKTLANSTIQMQKANTYATFIADDIAEGCDINRMLNKNIIYAKMFKI